MTAISKLTAFKTQNTNTAVPLDAGMQVGGRIELNSLQITSLFMFGNVHLSLAVARSLFSRRT